jgi:hypothetical protein
MTWDAEGASLSSAYLVVVAIPLLVVAARDALADALRGVARATWFALAALLVAWACAALFVLPHGAWEPNHHGLQRWASFRRGAWYNDNFTEQQHGFAWHAALRIVLFCAQGLLSPHAASVAVVSLGLVALFIAVRLWADDHPDADRVALVGVFGVLAHPVWLRLAPTGTVLAFAAAGLWGTAATALLAARRPQPSTVALCAAFAVWTMQTHLEQLALVPLLAAATVTAARRTPWHALARPAHLAVLAVGALALAPHLVVVLQGDPLAMAREHLWPDPQRTASAWAMRVFLLTTALGLMSYARLGAPGEATRPWLRVGALATAVVALLAHLEPARVLASGAETWSETRLNRLSALVDPSWGPPWLLGAAAVGAAACFPSRAFAAHAPIAALALLIYADKFDNFSTWLRATLPVLAWVGPMTGLGLITWGRALHPRWGLLPVLAATVVLLVPWAAPLTTPIDSQQEHDLLRAASEAQRAGETVHALTTADRGDVPAPDRFAWTYHRGHIDAWLASTDGAPPPTLTDLLALPTEQARGHLVLLGPECLRVVTSPPGQDAGANALIALGDRALGGVSLRDPIALTTDPRRHADLATWVPCAVEPAAPRCIEPDTTGGPCRTWACAPPSAAPRPIAWTQPACAAVRARFTLEAVREQELGPWSLNPLATDVLASGVPVGLYRVSGERAAP